MGFSAWLHWFKVLILFYFCRKFQKLGKSCKKRLRVLGDMLRTPFTGGAEVLTAGLTGWGRCSEFEGSGNNEQYQRVALGSFSARSDDFVSGVLFGL